MDLAGIDPTALIAHVCSMTGDHERIKGHLLIMAPFPHHTALQLQPTDAMHLSIPTLLAIATASSAALVPHLDVPGCPEKASVRYDRSIPNLTDFPLTQVDICWGEKDIEIDFTAYNETNFFYNSSLSTNDPIWAYEVMEAFLAPGTDIPTTYFEFEVAPNNITFNAFIFNPSKVREEGAAFERYYIQDPTAAGLVSTTKLDKQKQIWKSTACLPLSLWSIEEGRARNTKWRMNFFRTVVSPESFPEQTYGGWSSPDAANFHKTPFFGSVRFV